MCGRFNLRHNQRQLADHFDPAFPDYRLRYNIAPTQFVPLVRPSQERPGREVALMKWGLIPSWAADAKIGNSLINARGETVATKPTFRSAFKRRRCLVPSSGFYEWSGPPKDRQPYLFSIAEDRPFAFAGLWECWKKESEIVESFTIVTTEANDLLAKYHDRMPVILHPNDYDLWLRGTPGEVDVLLRPYPSDMMKSCPVSKIVNSPTNDVPECVEPVGV